MNLTHLYHLIRHPCNNADIIHDISEWPKKSDLVIITDQTVGVGGGGANVAFNLAALQVDYPLWPAGLLGCDTHGDLVRRACHDAGLPVEHLGQLLKFAQHIPM